MRQLKYHEKRLLKKVNFFDWKRDKNEREVRILQKYGINHREDYHKY
jgi:U3 small nucleolar ribonucleoprotein protein IMP3